MGIGKNYIPARSGQQLTAKGMNNNFVRGGQRSFNVSGNVNRRNFPDGVALDIPGGQAIAGSSIYQKHAIILDVFDDYYEVQTYNMATESVVGSSFYAAKPYTQQLTLYPEAGEAHEANDVILILKAISNVIVDGQNLQWVEAGAGGGGAGVIKSADNKTALTAILEEGELGYTTGTTKRGYWRINSTTICLTHLE